MKINWVLSKDIKKKLSDAKVITKIAPSWGSYSTWQNYKTDNCISIDLNNTNELMKRGFNTVCNLWVPEELYKDLGRPQGLMLFGGTFENDDFPDKEDFIALTLATIKTDIVLMLGFNYKSVSDVNRKNYYLNVMRHIKDNPGTQFVLVNHKNKLSKMFTNKDDSEIENLTMDSMKNVVKLLS